MLYVSEYEKGSNVCEVTDTCDDVAEEVEVSEVRKLTERGIQIPGVSPDRITSVTEEQAVNQCIALFLLTHPGVVNLDRDNKRLTVDCTNLPVLELPSIAYRYVLENANNTVIKITDPAWEVIQAADFIEHMHCKELDLSESNVRCLDTNSLGYDRFEAVTLGSNLKTLGRSCFFKNTIIKDITIPDNINSIDDSIFYRCESLKSVKLLNNLRVIPTGMFQHCLKLESIVTPDSNMKLGKFTLPDSVEILGDSAFENCMNFYEIEIPAGVKELEKNVFSNCHSLGIVKFKGNLIKTISKYCFYTCINLSEIELPYGITCIDEHAFSYCGQLKKVVIPDTIQEIKAFAFEYCTNLEEIEIPSLESIGVCAFKGCMNLRKVVLHGVKILEARIFSDCNNLESIELPSDLEVVSLCTFAECHKLREIIVPKSMCSSAKRDLKHLANNGIKLRYVR